MTILTDLTSVKAWLKKTDAENDDQLTELIGSVCHACEAYLGRPLERISRTELVPRVRQFERSFRLRANPVTVITSVKVATDGDFASATALDAETYAQSDLDSGTLHFNFDLQEGRNHIQVVYTGGIAPDIATIKTTHPDLHHAANLQIGHEWQRRNTPGSSSDRTTGASKTFVGEVALLKRVRELLDPHARSFQAHT